jgi:hypothetical protein
MVNIFVTSFSPKLSARHMSDLLVPRMCLEAVEILCAANWNKILDADNYTPKTRTPTREHLKDSIDLPAYRRSLGQRKHPACLWATRDLTHYDWLLDHAIALNQEYAMRFPQRSVLKCSKLFPYLEKHRFRFTVDYFPENVEKKHITYNESFSHLFPLAARKTYYRKRDIRFLYRLSMYYKYMYVYKRTHKWTNREPPEWLLSSEFDKFFFTEPTTLTGRYLKKTYGV